MKRLFHGILLAEGPYQFGGGDLYSHDAIARFPNIHRNKDMGLSEKILAILEKAYQRGILKSGIQPDLFPALAKHLARLVSQPACKSAMDDMEILAVMANHVYTDAPRVQGLIDGKKELWDELSTALLKFARWCFPKLREEDRQDIVQEALLRLAKHLPAFSFRASFDGYARKVLKNEFLRWQEKENRRINDGQRGQVETISMDQPFGAESTGENGLADYLPDGQIDIEKQVEQREYLDRLEKILDGLEFTLLSLDLAGYKLEEIRLYLGDNAPSISQISRILKRTREKLRNDISFPL